MKWTPQRLDQLGYLSRGRSRHRPRDAAHLYDGPFPFIQTSDVKHAGLYITNHEQTYSEAGLEQSKLWPAGTLCITIAANIADTSILAFDACFPDSVIGFIADEKKADTRFIKYFFDATIQRRVQQFTQGAAQDNLSQEKLLSIEFAVPEINQQKRIADILSAYDELIENNRRRMRLLEEAARQLYREWVVRLRFPGHEHTRITNGVPEGWERATLGNLCTLRAGGIFKPKYQGQSIGQIPFIKVRDLSSSNNGIATVESDNWVTADECEDFGGQPFSPGTVVFAKIGEALRKNRVRFIVRETLIDNNLMGAVPIREDDAPLLYVLLAHYDFGTNASGAAVPFLSAKVLSEEKFLVPSEVIRQQFNEIAGCVLQQCATVQRQSAEASRARDLLLPRLMSGEIAV